MVLQGGSTALSRVHRIHAGPFGALVAVPVAATIDPRDSARETTREGDALG